MTVTQKLQSKKSIGYLSGFGNLFARESRKWWRSRRWWMQSLLWLVILNGIVVFGLFVMPTLVEESGAEMQQAAESGVQTMTAEQFQQDVPNLLFGLATFFLPVGVIILVQGQVYAEKQSGITAWILSKPVVRPAYLLAKFLADWIGIVLVLVILQMATAYLLLTSVIEVNTVGYITAVALLIMLLLFYQSFTLMMSVMGNSTEIVLGASMGLFLGGSLLKNPLAQIFGDAVFATPWMLPDAIALAVTGEPLPPQLQITVVAVPALTVACLLLMIWQFHRQEL
ncbi:MAG: hypothetical protein CL607_17305 [Anaerolineaceae bacterium]|nr:hypothetical protein [Anaerolineaceae bacterium]